LHHLLDESVLPGLQLDLFMVEETSKIEGTLLLLHPHLNPEELGRKLI
jgi:hypothetical protein